MKGSKEFRKPTPGHLPKSIQRFFQSVNLLWLSWVKFERWEHVNILLQISMEESIIDIYLVHWPVPSWSNRDQCPEGHHFCTECKSLNKVHHFFLCVSRTTRSLYLFHQTIGFMLNLIDQFPTQSTFSSRQLSQFPSPVILQSTDSCFIASCYLELMTTSEYLVGSEPVIVDAKQCLCRSNNLSQVT